MTKQAEVPLTPLPPSVLLMGLEKASANHASPAREKPEGRRFLLAEDMILRGTRVSGYEDGCARGAMFSGANFARPSR